MTSWRSPRRPKLVTEPPFRYEFRHKGWPFTRIVGVPSGGVLVRMPVGFLDLAATLTEAALVAVLVGMLADPKPNLPPRW